MTIEQSSTDKQKERTELLEKWIFVLLYSDSMNGIVGKVRFTKNFFLILKHFAPDAFKLAEFYPDDLGPYSKIMSKILDEMVENKYIEKHQVNQDSEFRLSENGKKKAENIVKGIDQDVFNKISEIKRYNNEISFEELLRYIYMDYPEYASKSKMKHVMIETADLSDDEIIDDGPGFVATNLEEEIIINVDEKTYLRLFS